MHGHRQHGQGHGAHAPGHVAHGQGHMGHGHPQGGFRQHTPHQEGRRQQESPVEMVKNQRPQPPVAAAPGAAPVVAAPPAPPTAQQIEEIVKKTKNILFEKLSPLCKNDRVDFSVSSHNGRIEFSFPLKNKINLITICQIVSDTAKKTDSVQGETLIAFLREKFMCLRIKDTSANRYAPPYRIEIMIPLDCSGNGLVMGGASGFTLDDIDMCESLYRLAIGVAKDGKAAEVKETKESVVDKLRGLGVDVMLPDGWNEDEDKDGETKKPQLDPELEKLWDTIAGYDDLKGAVKQCVTLPLMRPELFDRMAALTRGNSGQKAKTSGVLFTGPPGVGKTSMAKVASHIASTPLVYVPVESVVSKWYGEAEQKLRSVFELTRKLGKAVLFLDELDAFAGNRDNSMHEVTRRMLSVLLRQLDGLDNQDVNKDGKDGKEGADGEEKEKKKWHVVLVGATNRPSDLDAALRSRFNKLIDFPLPNEETRALIFKNYSKTLENAELAQLAAAAEGFSGRDIRECADDAEHNWVATLLNEGGFDMSLRELQPPPYRCYLESVHSRRKGKEIKY